MDEDRTEAVLVAPIWSTQPWFGKLLGMISAQSYVLPPVTDILAMPGYPDRQHRLEKLRLAVFRLSGNASSAEDYQSKLPTSSWHHGDRLHSNSMGRMSKMAVIL